MMDEVSSSETSVSSGLHGAKFQKTAIFILVAVRTSKLLKVHYSVHKSPPLDPVLSPINADHILTLL
jgi:hypothetical protein